MLKRVRTLVEAAIDASRSYLTKETVRQELEEMIRDRIRSSVIKDDDDLKEFFLTLNMAASALKMVPFDIWDKEDKR